jgi:hypothetical protein
MNLSTFQFTAQSLGSDDSSFAYHAPRPVPSLRWSAPSSRHRTNFVATLLALSRRTRGAGPRLESMLRRRAHRHAASACAFGQSFPHVSSRVRNQLARSVQSGASLFCPVLAHPSLARADPSPLIVLVRSGHTRCAVADDAAPQRVPGKPALTQIRAGLGPLAAPSPGSPWHRAPQRSTSRSARELNRLALIVAALALNARASASPCHSFVQRGGMLAAKDCPSCPALVHWRVSGRQPTSPPQGVRGQSQKKISWRATARTSNPCPLSRAPQSRLDLAAFAHSGPLVHLRGAAVPPPPPARALRAPARRYPRF